MTKVKTIEVKSKDELKGIYLHSVTSPLYWVTDTTAKNLDITYIS